MSDWRKRSGLLLALLCALLLCGCGDSEPKPDPEKLGVTELSLVIEGNELYKLNGYDSLQSVDLSGSRCYDEILDWARRNPGVAVRYTVQLPDGTEAANDAETLDLSALSDSQIGETLPLLHYLPQVEKLTLGSGRRSPETVQALLDACPGADVDYNVTVGSLTVPLDAESLDLTGVEDFSGLAEWLPYLTRLKQVELGASDGEATDLGFWRSLAELEAVAPQAEFHYAYTLYGKSFTLQDELMDFNHITMEDRGELVQAAALCMPKLSYLDMDFCGVENEDMAAIRDSLPNATVVWRIWFGERLRYTARTDTERILASNPDRGGELTGASTEVLKYCTKVRLLDLGHNEQLEDISFVAYMPDLEVAVLAMNQWTDARPLMNCPKLEYLEMQTGACSDLRPIATLKNLRHLNICYCFALRDLSPIYDLDLERLWVGCLTPIPAEQVQEYQRRHPKCEINTTCVDPTTEGWRVYGYNEYGMVVTAPRYALLREQFEYDESQSSYNYIENDPKYWGGSWSW